MHNSPENPAPSFSGLNKDTFVELLNEVHAPQGNPEIVTQLVMSLGVLAVIAIKVVPNNFPGVMGPMVPGMPTSLTFTPFDCRLELLDADFMTVRHTWPTRHAVTHHVETTK